MRLVATIKDVRGRATNDPAEMAPAATLEIIDADQGYYLIRYSLDGGFSGDEWYADLYQCKRAVMEEFGIGESEWRDE